MKTTIAIDFKTMSFMFNHMVFSEKNYKWLIQKFQEIGKDLSSNRAELFIKYKT